MTTILTVFILALFLSLVLTPLAGRLGTRFGALDRPQERKVHTRPLPRTGGLAILIAFVLALTLSSLFTTEVSNNLIIDNKIAFLLIGALIAFGVGIFDDFHRLGPGIKFLFQVIAASVAFWGGLRIEIFSIFGVNLDFGIVSYAITVFWFVFFINAVNLIDGLDGLAGGVTLFASIVLVILCVFMGQYYVAMVFGALGGATLGFLRYNFNPASIFMGDGGSYFLGYTIAGLSIMSSIKSQVGAAMLIPIVALGVPVFDTILSPIRRFILGREVFRPDKGHIHHKLVAMGISTRKTVWIIYGISLCLCVVAVILVNIRDERAGLFLILLGIGAVVFMRKLGYFEYLASDKIYGWFRDVTDEAGFSHDRRSFLNLQIEIDQSQNIDELWLNVCKALEKLKFDTAELHLEDGLSSGRIHKEWLRNQDEGCKTFCNEYLLKLELPLLDHGKESFGVLRLVKDLKQDSISHYTLRRVEHLRRTLIGTIAKIAKNDLNANNANHNAKKKFGAFNIFG